jgi:hypothetical protein
MEFPEKSDFNMWLKDFPSDKVVGVPCHMNHCPLATYLNVITHKDTAYVRPDRLARDSCWRISDDGSDRKPLPEWANDFARTIDTYVGEITANQAILILKGC